jgi:uncharacterized protein YaiE (UPF0345 family)
MSSIPEKFDGVSVVCKANVYFGGKVVSHTILFADGGKKTCGLIYPGTYTFDTKAAEEMAVVDGSCRVKLRGEKDFKSFKAGSAFNVPANSAFDIAVDEGVAQYICSYK